MARCHRNAYVRLDEGTRQACDEHVPIVAPAAKPGQWPALRPSLFVDERQRDLRVGLGVAVIEEPQHALA
jgi:hypothetical protein